jgi:hypothetical protein
MRTEYRPPSPKFPLLCFTNALPRKPMCSFPSNPFVSTTCYLATTRSLLSAVTEGGTWTLPSNGSLCCASLTAQFRRSGVMSQYYILECNAMQSVDFQRTKQQYILEEIYLYNHTCDNPQIQPSLIQHADWLQINLSNCCKTTIKEPGKSFYGIIEKVKPKLVN